ncbi:hypothetical protein [Streptomyces sp. B21-101]|uniref:hypothetical protein n=1 Tax=Streptomyces sp. B21-101 TaxID=3039415 RepID=UPI002FF03CA3
MPKQLTTQNASITTVAIEVKALTIGSKQVTQSVFRQLQEEPLIAHDGTLNGVPWGRVNYHPDCSHYRRQHMHVVWQVGDELRRARVDCTPRFDPDGKQAGAPAEFVTEKGDRLLTSSVREWLDGRRPDCPLVKEYGKYGYLVSYKSGRGFPVVAQVSTLAVAAAQAREALDNATRWAAEDGDGWTRSEEWLSRARQERQERLSKAQAAYDAARAELAAEVAVWGHTHDELLADFHAACQQEADRRQRHRDVRATLAQLPHLFIAV